tara:strand:- start:1699 stop:2997 length:1299 start_codon:yes stop_codon:yes gene_type:complete
MSSKRRYPRTVEYNEKGWVINNKGERVDAYKEDPTIKEALKMIEENNCPWEGGDCEDKIKRSVWRVKPPTLELGDPDYFGRLSLDESPLRAFVAEEKAILDDWEKTKYHDITSGNFGTHMKREKKVALRIKKCKELKKFYEKYLDAAKEDLKIIKSYFKVKGFDDIRDGMHNSPLNAGMFQRVPEIEQIEQFCLDGLAGKRLGYLNVARSGYQFLDGQGGVDLVIPLDEQIEADTAQMGVLKVNKENEKRQAENEKRQAENRKKRIDTESKSRRAQHYLTGLKFNGEILAPKDGTVKFAVRVNDIVEKGQLILELDLDQAGGDFELYKKIKDEVGKKARKAQQYLAGVKFDGKIYAPKAGTVTFAVEEGARVKKGQLLLFLRVKQEGGSKRIYKRKKTRRKNSKYIKKTKKYKKSKRNKRKNAKRKNTKIRK